MFVLKVTRESRKTVELWRTRSSVQQDLNHPPLLQSLATWFFFKFYSSLSLQHPVNELQHSPWQCVLHRIVLFGYLSFLKIVCIFSQQIWLKIKKFWDESENSSLSISSFEKRTRIFFYQSVLRNRKLILKVEREKRAGKKSGELNIRENGPLYGPKNAKRQHILP